MDLMQKKYLCTIHNVIIIISLLLYFNSNRIPKVLKEYFGNFFSSPIETSNFPLVKLFYIFITKIKKNENSLISILFELLLTIGET